MKIKAKISFCGKVSLSMGEIKDVDDAAALDLIKAGLAEEVADEVSEPAKPSAKAKTKGKKD